MKKELHTSHEKHAWISCIIELSEDINDEMDILIHIKGINFSVEARASGSCCGPTSGFNAGPVAEDIYEWQATLLAPPPSSPYEGGIFFISICFPSEYPFRPPMVSLKTPILHSNIDKPRVFHPLLVTATWRVGTMVKELLQAFHDMLLHPKVEEEDNYLADVARMCVLELERFKKEARLMTEAHAMNYIMALSQ
ncbi:hypothetical protein EUTSA_v10005558mg [Eutrema salsugineum]|uniref:UBC core domain-containing protein n=1 Tax=Eutrema salsugineum TaxID=72664 RepID=V4MNR4_EUTSA|nr:hypothetical protein EUTSA_v10005558mg [Eutrema salsugineum]